MRVAQIYEAIDNLQVQIVLELRGSYGMSRLLPLTDICRLTASKKIFVSYSDITALHLALLAPTGAPSRSDTVRRFR